MAGKNDRAGLRMVFSPEDVKALARYIKSLPAGEE